MELKISGYSTALFSTWYFIENLGILFDAGDGVTSALTQKSGKVRNVFISHADRDHLTGLLQFNQLNARDGVPVIHYPKDCGSFNALKDFSARFDPHVKGIEWLPIADQEKIQINDKLYVQAIVNGHVKSEKQVKSLSFKVIEAKRKLKSEYQNLNKKELKELAIQKGGNFITELEETEILGYSGDTPVENPDRWRNTKVLIHEATFLGKSEDRNINTHGNAHSSLNEVLKMVTESKVEQLILGHFSTRYNKEEIDNQIVKYCKEYSVKIPVYRVLPGQTEFDILSHPPVFE